MPAPEGFNPLKKHSLEAWGARLKQKKVEHDEWDRFSGEMLLRCRGDVSLNRSVYLALSRRMRDRGFSELSCYIEHGAHVVIDEQMANGIFFDLEKGKELLKCLRGEQDRLTVKIRETFKPELVKLKEYKYKERAGGQPYASFLRHQALGELPNYGLRWNKDQSQYSLWRAAEFNIASPPQRLKRLLKLGYIPQKKTKSGGPSVDEESLLEFARTSGIDEVKDIAEWLVLFGRANAIENWLGFASEDSRIHGRVWACGASSRRMTHTRPNSANIPSEANNAKYGKECRALWTATPGKTLVGVDAKSCQMRIFLHYVRASDDLKKIYLEGDPHQYNADGLTEALSFEVSRGGGGAKTIYYAFLFGAGDKKLGSILNKDAKIGAKIREAMYSVTPGLEKLIKDSEQEFNSNNGFLQCIDGGYVRCPSINAALNYKIQSAEAVSMKLSAILFREWLISESVDAFWVGNIHDEWQLESRLEDAERVGMKGSEFITTAGEALQLTVPLAGDFKIGFDWSLTH